MEKVDAKGRPIKFIRVRGRVVPIPANKYKPEGGQPQQKMAKPSAAGKQPSAARQQNAKNNLAQSKSSYYKTQAGSALGAGILGGLASRLKGKWAIAAGGASLGLAGFGLGHRIKQSYRHGKKNKSGLKGLARFVGGEVVSVGGQIAGRLITGV